MSEIIKQGWFPPTMTAVRVIFFAPFTSSLFQLWLGVGVSTWPSATKYQSTSPSEIEGLQMLVSTDLADMDVPCRFSSQLIEATTSESSFLFMHTFLLSSWCLEMLNAPLVQLVSTFCL